VAEQSESLEVRLDDPGIKLEAQVIDQTPSQQRSNVEEEGKRKIELWRED
jgi:hypothetical protein